MSYQAPIRDMQFVLHEVLDSEQIFAQLPGLEEANRELIDQVLDEGAKICEAVALPLDMSGDEQGCRLTDDGVVTPNGFPAAYQALQEAGWLALSCDTESGGQGMPHTVGVMFEEMFQSANLSLSLYAGLNRGAYIAVKAHADEALKQAYLPKMVSGEWAGVMCLTEPQCGTDLGLLRTKAEPNGDGTYKVSGTKIFITGGDQDITDNIVHLVLARLPDAPEGVKGISMFLVPKYLPDGDGALGERNALHCASLEHKMGLNGSATCEMSYEGATGWIVGEPNKGLRAMFSMMNFERLMVGQQGLSQAEKAYQKASAYAKERLQGRSLSGVKAPELAADPIIVHPDVRRMLMSTRAYNESARTLLAWVSLQVDIAERHPDPARREAADDLVALFTPVIKAFFSDYGYESCTACQQVFGGHGYLRDWGMEQLVRDARIAQIYEGANGIHALDLVGRKLPMHDGRLMQRYLDELDNFVDEAGADESVAEFLPALRDSAQLLKQAVEWIAQNGKSDPDEVGAASYDFLNLMALTSLAHMWVKMARVASAKLATDNTGYYQNKLIMASYFVQRILPRVRSLHMSLTAGGGSLMAMQAEAF